MPVDDACVAGAGTFVIVAFIALWYLATHGKGTAPGRLVAWLVAIIVIWIMVSLKNPAAADRLVDFVKTGLSAAFTGIGDFLGALFHPPG